MAVLHIDESNFDTLLTSDKPVLIDFWASWCGPCQMLSPTIDLIADENPQFTVGKINVDEQPELAAAFRIESIPTLVVLKGGKIVNISVGVKTKEQILEMLS